METENLVDSVPAADDASVLVLVHLVLKHKSLWAVGWTSTRTPGLEEVKTVLLQRQIARASRQKGRIRTLLWFVMVSSLTGCLKGLRSSTMTLIPMETKTTKRWSRRENLAAPQQQRRNLQLRSLPKRSLRHREVQQSKHSSRRCIAARLASHR